MLARITVSQHWYLSVPFSHVHLIMCMFHFHTSQEAPDT
jgi:hypothetical protein